MLHSLLQTQQQQRSGFRRANMSSWGKDEAEEGDGEEDEDDLYKSVNDHLIFLIDCRENMFRKNIRQEVTMVASSIFRPFTTVLY
jgi:hypothetical protein